MTPEQTRVESLRLYAAGQDAYHRYPAPDADAHTCGLMAIYDVAFLEGIKHAQKEAKEEKEA